MGSLPTSKTAENNLTSFAPASSFIQTVEYDESNRSMDITFRSGTKMRYLYVFPVTYLSFKQSPVHSAFYARAIKGNLTGVKLIDAGIGQEKSAPLKQVKREEPIDRGIRDEQARNERVWGTVSRAFNAAAVES